jgi:cytoskeletal protein CcmA (bactofilin family)
MARNWMKRSGNSIRVGAQRPSRLLLHHRWLIGLVIVLGVLFSGTALAAAIVGEDELYELAEGQVVDDDLYVAARQVIINGTVNGDLVVAGASILVNGVVTGDLLAAGAVIIVNGVIQDDARLFGAQITVNGAIRDDLLAAGGGGRFAPFMGAFFANVPFMGNQLLSPGVRVGNVTLVGGDALIAAGEAVVAGNISGDLRATGERITYSGSTDGNAYLNAEQLNVDAGARVAGTLTYATAADLTIPPAVSLQVVQEPYAAPAAGPGLLQRLFGWLFRTAMILLGLALLGWLIWRFAPRRLEQSITALNVQPVQAVLYGLLVAVALAPLSVALVFLAVLFWGWFPGGIVMFAFLFGFFSLLWIFSPAWIGLWIGRKLVARTASLQGDLAALFVGIVVIALAAQVLALIPFVGGFAARVLYLFSFAFAVGSLLIRRPVQPQAPQLYAPTGGTQAVGPHAAV